jgi:hypothetical protein
MGRKWIAIVVPAILYGASHTGLDFLPPAEPFWGRALALTVVGCVWGWAFLRYLCERTTPAAAGVGEALHGVLFTPTLIKPLLLSRSFQQDPVTLALGALAFTFGGDFAFGELKAGTGKMRVIVRKGFRGLAFILHADTHAPVDGTATGQKGRLYSLTRQPQHLNIFQTGAGVLRTIPAFDVVATASDLRRSRYGGTGCFSRAAIATACQLRSDGSEHQRASHCQPRPAKAPAR